jgi:hypothetical protein
MYYYINSDKNIKSNPINLIKRNIHDVFFNDTYIVNIYSEIVKQYMDHDEFPLKSSYDRETNDTVIKISYGSISVILTESSDGYSYISIINKYDNVNKDKIISYMHFLDTIIF